MPAGDLLAADYQVEIRGLLTGDGTDYDLGERGIEGLDELPVDDSGDVPLDEEDGAHLGQDHTGPRTVTVDYLITVPGDPAGAGALYFEDLRPAWAKSTSTDLELHLQLPGFGHLMFTGRPRGLLADLTRQKHGLIRAFATFHCGDPTITVVP